MSGPAWVLAPHARVLESKDAVIVLGPGGDARAFEGVSGPFAREVLDLLRAPRERVDVLAGITARAEGDFDPKVVGDLLDVLAAIGAIVPADAAPAAPAVAPRPVAARRRVVLCVSGAIQAVEAPRLATILDARGFDVRVAITDAARRFVSALALEAITHARVVTSMWPDADASLKVPHVDLARWADAVVVYPASATTISRIATGDCSDVVAAIAITTRAPVVVAPSMNDAMLDAPAVQRNLEQLVDDGFAVVWPSVGVEVADAPGARARRVGPAPSPEHIVPLLELALAHLERSGPTRAEPIDWDAAYAATDAPPWEADVDDAPLARALAAVPPPRSLLDLGCGSGARAIRLAESGYRVVAIDVSDAALDRARARPGADRVVFLRDDVRATELRSTFDVLLDRGCFHSLDDTDDAGYRAAVHARLAPGGAVVVVHDGPLASPARRTRRLAPAAVAATLDLVVEDSEPATIAPDDALASFVTRLRRR